MSATQDFEGVVPILAMPFRANDEIDGEALAGEAEALVRLGVRALGFGFASEIQALTDSERDEAIRIVAARLQSRAVLVASVWGGSGKSVFEHAERARAAGATALLAPPPPGSDTAESALAFYSALGRAVELPIVVQDAPDMSGVDLSPATLARLAAEVEHVVALKIEPVPSAPKMTRVIDAAGDDGILILGGGGGLDFWNELRRGARGTIPGAAMTGMFLKVWRLAVAERPAEAKALFDAHLPLLLLANRSMDVFLHVQKELLCRAQVLISTRLRAPTEVLDEAFATELGEALVGTDLDLLPASD